MDSLSDSDANRQFSNAIAYTSGVAENYNWV